MRTTNRARPGATALAIVALLGLVGCAGAAPSGARFQPELESADPAPAPPTLEITPKAGATGLPISTEIGTRTDGKVTAIRLAAGTKVVSGTLRDDGTSWVPDQPLTPDTAYQATVTVTGLDGQTTTAQTHFTTMAAPGPRATTALYLFEGREYGVAMPVVVQFTQPVPEEARAGVQRRLFVTTDPPQPGVWHWASEGRQVFYRAPEYWRPGTTIRVRSALAGHPVGGGRFGDQDRTATVTIDRKRAIEIDDGSKRLSVYDDEGELVKSMKVSLGKPSTPSSSGHMVIMSKERETVFDTFAELGPEAGYRVNISYAMRLTWGGEYIHSAPWSVADQGVRNVSHGCVNLAPADAKWLFETARIGDPVIVKGTGTALAPGNGWTAWNLTWEEFVAGSALPVPEELAVP